METMKLLYENNKYKYDLLGSEVEFILTDALIDKEVKISHIEKRIKTFKSIMGKLEKKDIKTDNPFTFDDTLGVRVVCLFLSDIEKIGDVIRDEFDVIEEDNKITNQELDRFGYMSVHYICKLKNHTNGRKMNKIKHIKFEIQVRTITMHSWANISHYLSYKSKNDIPSDLKKDFNALSGLFYVVDKHFEMFYKESKHTQEDISKSLNEESNYEQEINLDSLETYLQIKFKDRSHVDRDDLSEFIEELQSTPEIKTIRKLDEIIDKTLDAALQNEKDIPPVDADTFCDTKYKDIGIIRTCMDIYSFEFYVSRHNRTKKTKEEQLADYNKDYGNYMQLVHE